MNKLEKTLDELGYYVSTIHGVSMYPLLFNKKDTVYLEKKDKENLKKYDVALFRRNGKQLVLHRIIGVKGNVLTMRGDSELIIEKINREDVIAVMVEYTHKGKNHSTKEIGYKVYSRIWHFLFPFRRHLLKAYRLMNN